MMINIELKLSKEIEEEIKKEALEKAEECLLRDKQELRKIIHDSVKGAIRANISELLQGKDFRNFLRDKIAMEIGM